MVRKEEVLARTSNGLDVFRHYLPVKWRVGRNFLNPLYADSKASCNVYYDRRSGTYRMKDFGNGDYSGRLFLPRGEAERAGLPELRRLRGGAAHHRPGAVPRTGRGQPDRRDGGNRGLPEIAARAGRKGRRRRGSRNGHGRGGSVRRPSRAEAYRAAEKPFTEGELAYWGASGITVEVLRRYGTVSLAEYRGETRKARRSASVPPRRNRCSATRGNGA